MEDTGREAENLNLVKVSQEKDSSFSNVVTGTCSEFQVSLGYKVNSRLAGAI